jgi:succinate dehydrogenase flavin-adding protein (antitoxin of CptAB toxin-antitoxin module)
MIKKLVLGLFLGLFSAGVMANDVSVQEHKRGLRNTPCGEHGEQRDSLIGFYQHEYNATYKELNKKEIDIFLKRVNQEDSDIVNVRVLQSPFHDSYAIIASHLFQNFLDGNLLVEVYCAKKIGDSFVIYIKGDMFKEFIGKDFSELGKD